MSAPGVAPGGAGATGGGVRLDAVAKSYGARGGAGPRAVDGVSLAVAPGEFFSLLGPSGCGKTTTLRMVAGLEAPDEGRVLVGGRDVTALPPEARNLGMVFQSYALFPHRTVAENVAFGLRMRGVPRAEAAARVREALGMVRLDGLEERRPAQLSGGQQQRVALARAIVVRPAVLLCDEPLGALDKKLRQAMQFELKALHRRLGLTLLYVTHDQEEALTMSDRIGVMSAGRLAQVGTPREIYDRPATRFVADFIGDTNLLEGELAPDGVPRAVRPERVRLGPPGAPGARAGRVEEANFLGDAVLLRVALGATAGEALLVRAPRGTDPALLAPGAAVSVAWDEADAVPLVA